MNVRDLKVDILRGILIILVVIAHYNREFPHDIIFLFHMPLFFIVSGYLVTLDRISDNGFIKKKIKSLMIPYFSYLTLDLLLVQKAKMLDFLKDFLWGGRLIGGVYWYVTCYLFTLLCFTLIIKNSTEKVAKCLILTGGYSSNRIALCG